MSAKMAQSLGERFGLQQWAGLLLPLLPASAKGRHGTLAIAPLKSLRSEKSVSEERKRDLVKLLLEVYINGS